MIHYSLHGIALSPGCVFILAEPGDSSALPHHASIGLLTMTSTIAVAVLPSLLDVCTYLLINQTL